MKKISYVVGVRADASLIVEEHVLEVTKVKRVKTSAFGLAKDNSGLSSCSRNAKKRSREAPLLSLNRKETYGATPVAPKPAQKKNQRCSSRGMKK